ncbi:MAG: hypothetical protein V4529_00760 [Gemmatimonadota bacterium]
MKSLYGVFGAALLVIGCSDSAVAPIPGVPDPTLSDLGTMNVGDVRAMTFSAASGGLSIPASSGSAQFAVVLGNSNVNAGTVGSYGVRGDWLTPSVQIPVADVFPPAQRPLEVPGTISRGEQFEAQLRNFERTGLPRPGGRRNAATGAAASANVLTPSRAVNAAPAVGSTMSLKVLTAAGFGGVSAKACDAGSSTTTLGMVRYVSTHAIVVSDVNSPAGGFTDADFKSIGDEFDQMIYPTDVGYFGTPTDIDNNGHIIIYYTPAVNKLTPAGSASKSGYVGGFFFAGDLYPPTSAGCLSSNQGEIFYLLAPDPNGVNGNSFSTAFVRQITRGTVAHEFQHMINSGNRYISPSVVNFEATWLDEGLAHFAEEAVGRVEAGFADNTTVGLSDINNLDTTITQAFFLQNLARAKYYVERPDTTAAIVSHPKAAANLASRGAEWALVRYVADWFNTGGDPRTLTRKLVAGPDTGTANLVKATGAPMDTILAHFLVTLYADHRAATPPASPYNFKSYNFRQLVSGVLIGSETSASYLPVAPVGTGASLTANVPASSAAYFVTSGSGARTIRITNAGGTTSSDPNGRVYVMRVQ